MNVFVLIGRYLFCLTLLQTVEGSAKYDILVKLKRNDKEEKYKANVHKDNDGKFHVNNLVQDHS